MNKCKYCDLYKMDGDSDYSYKELKKISDRMPLLFDGAQNAELDFSIALAKSYEDGWILTSNFMFGSVTTEDLNVKIRYCPFCGRKLEDGET